MPSAEHGASRAPGLAGRIPIVVYVLCIMYDDGLIKGYGPIIIIIIAHWTLNREVESSNPPGGAGGKMDKTSGS